MTDTNTFEKILAELGKVLLPISHAISSPSRFRAFMLKMGWHADTIPQPIQDIADGIEELYTVLRKVLGNGLSMDGNVSLESGDLDFSGEDINSIIFSVKNIIEGIIDLSTAPDTEFSADLLADNFKDDFPEQFFSHLVISYLTRFRPQIAFAVRALGVIKTDYRPAVGNRPSYIDYSLDFSDIPKIMDGPEILFENAFSWGNDDFDFREFTSQLDNLFLELGFDTYIEELESETYTAIEGGVDIPGDPVRDALNIVFFVRERPTGRMAAEVKFLYLPKDGSKKPGIAILPSFNGAVDFTMDVGGNLSLTFTSNLDLTGGIGVLLRPDIKPELLTGFNSGSGASQAEGEVRVKLENKNEAREPIVIIGQAGASRLEFLSASGSGGLTFNTQNDQLEILVEAALKGGKLAIGGGEGDGFLQKILPADGIQATFELTLGYSTLRGFYFLGSGGVDIRLPVHLSLGPIEIDTITLGFQPKNGKIPINLGADISANLGPLTAVVENMGLRAEFSFPSGGGNLGPLNLDMGFKPPNGVGLSIDAGAVKGGGYLFFDFDRGEYAGALELVFSEWIELKAIGLITTKMPDGSKGFSLLIIITVEFGSGIQLGFGFTLLGVGGLLGLNRMTNIEALKDGVRTGSVENVMFPNDVIANAPRIISDLKQFFPLQLNVFLVGPMAKIGWGTPTLVSAQIGLILEFPSVNITILGVIKVVLPDEEADVLRLQVNFIGRLEPSNKLLWFYAELYDSRVLFITLEGGFGLLINWGDQANFVVSVGGFHPKYSPPPLPFPEPPRIAVNILNESYAKVRIEAYFAVTSNSVQFGARAELFFGVSAFNIEGHLGFDALFQFNPFFFSFGISVGLSVKVFGIGLFSIGFSGLLEGPTPWHIEGKGSISILFFSISVPFEHTWGNEQDTQLDPIAVRPILEAEFNALTNWEAQVPASNSLLVSLRQLGESDTDQLVLHPVGKLKISQRKVPVNFTLDKVGNQKPSDYNKFTVDAELSGGAGLSTSAVEEKFAIGQFKDLDGSGRLSSPGFEPLESGLEIGVAGSQIKTSKAVRRVIRYETIVIDNNFKRHINTFFTFFVSGFFVLNEFLFNHFLKGSAAAKSVHSKNHKKKFKPFDETVKVRANEYSVAFNSNNEAVDSAATQFTSQAKAVEFMNGQISNDSTLKSKIHVIPNTELNKAA